MRGQIPGQGQEIQVFMMGGGWRPREIRFWGRGGEKNKGMSQTTGGLVFSKTPPLPPTHTQRTALCVP